MDIEKAKEIDSSLNWKEICNELDAWIKAEEVNLRNCTSEGLEKIQMTIRTLDKVKSLPQIVIDRDS